MLRIVKIGNNIKLHLKNVTMRLESEFISPVLMISRNSSNSIQLDPSSSTDSIIYLTSYLECAKPKEIKGSSSSSIPIPSLFLILSYP